MIGRVLVATAGTAVAFGALAPGAAFACTNDDAVNVTAPVTAPVSVPVSVSGTDVASHARVVDDVLRNTALSDIL